MRSGFKDTFTVITFHRSANVEISREEFTEESVGRLAKVPIASEYYQTHFDEVCEIMHYLYKSCTGIESFGEGTQKNAR